jgi:cell division initiation protein
MLKPADVQSKEFEIKMRGYDRDQVDDFLDEIIRDFTVLYRDNTELTSKLEAAEAEMAQLKAKSEEAEKSIELARYQCEEMKKSAMEEANRIIKQAKAQTANVASDIENSKIRMKALCTEFLEKIDSI